MKHKLILTLLLLFTLSSCTIIPQDRTEEYYELVQEEEEININYNKFISLNEEDYTILVEKEIHKYEIEYTFDWERMIMEQELELYLIMEPFLQDGTLTHTNSLDTFDIDNPGYLEFTYDDKFNPPYDFKIEVEYLDAATQYNAIMVLNQHKYTYQSGYEIVFNAVHDDYFEFNYFGTHEDTSFNHRHVVKMREDTEGRRYAYGTNVVMVEYTDLGYLLTIEEVIDNITTISTFYVVKNEYNDNAHRDFRTYNNLYYVRMAEHDGIKYNVQDYWETESGDRFVRIEMQDSEGTDLFTETYPVGHTFNDYEFEEFYFDVWIQGNRDDLEIQLFSPDGLTTYNYIVELND